MREESVPCTRAPTPLSVESRHGREAMTIIIQVFSGEYVERKSVCRARVVGKERMTVRGRQEE